MKALILALTILTLPTAQRIKPTGNEACTVIPNPTANGDYLNVAGTGFQPGIWFFVSFNGEKEPLDAALSAEDGSIIFALGATRFPQAGTWKAGIYLDSHRYYWQPDRRSFPFAECPVEVQ